MDVLDSLEQLFDRQRPLAEPAPVSGLLRRARRLSEASFVDLVREIERIPVAESR